MAFLEGNGILLEEPLPLVSMLELWEERGTPVRRGEAREQLLTDPSPPLMPRQLWIIWYCGLISDLDDVNISLDHLVLVKLETTCR